MGKRTIIKLCWQEARRLANLRWGWYGKAYGWHETAGCSFQGALLSAGFTSADAYNLRKLYA
jgi:hypothetical protein